MSYDDVHGSAALEAWTLLREMVNNPELLDPEGSDAMKDLMRTSGVAGGALRVLRHLPFEGTVAMRDLVTLLGHDKSRTTVTLNALQRHGYVTRSIDPDDRRSRLVGLTAAGRPLAREARLLHARPPAALRRLSVDELQILQALLQRIEGSDLSAHRNNELTPSWPKLEGARIKGFPLA